jgi:hypothetical protein
MLDARLLQSIYTETVIPQPCRILLPLPLAAAPATPVREAFASRIPWGRWPAWEGLFAWPGEGVDVLPSTGTKGKSGHSHVAKDIVGTVNLDVGNFTDFVLDEYVMLISEAQFSDLQDGR